MKHSFKLVLVVLVSGLMLFEIQAQAQTISKTQTTEKKQLVKDTKVYVTKTGVKYHKSTCSYLRKSKIEKTLSTAKAAGYTACSRCSGGTPSTTKAKTTTSSRCSATTQAGNQCKRNSSSGSSYCWQHK